MSTIKNLVVGVVSYTALSAAAIIGMGVGAALWNNGLEEKVEKKAKEWFSKE